MTKTSDGRQLGTVAGRAAAGQCGSWEHGKLKGDSSRTTTARAATTVPPAGGDEQDAMSEPELAVIKRGSPCVLARLSLGSLNGA